MSSRLPWEPVKDCSGYLSDELKLALQDKYGYGFDWIIFLDEQDIPYLNGLADAKVEAAQTLIDLIKQHGKVALSEEYEN